MIEDTVSIITMDKSSSHEYVRPELLVGKTTESALEQVDYEDPSLLSGQLENMLFGEHYRENSLVMDTNDALSRTANTIICIERVNVS
jgi:hypothetical protein